MENKLDELTKIQIERLAHIEIRAYFLGRVGRKDLTTRYGIKDAAATRDFTKYNELAPKNLIYDTRERIYVPSDSFKPLFNYSTNRIMSTLSEGFGDGLEENYGIDDLICETPALLNKPKINILSILTRAIINKQVLEITYRSITSGETKRQIVPFGLVDNGLRWHIRAWDRRRGQFTDFVVTRVSEPRLLENEVIQDHEEDKNDSQWNTIITLELIPHPRLKNKETIEKDYGMRNGIKKVELRAAVAGYILRRWNVDCSAKYELEGDEYQLALRNIDKLDENVETMFLAPGFKR